MINDKLEVSHPGLYIEDAMQELGISQNEFAIRLGVLPKTLSTLINGHSNITFEIAAKLSSFFKNSVQFWMNLQVMYDIYLYQQELEKEIENQWSIVNLFDKTFLEDICEIKIDKKNKENIIDKLKEIFMVSSLENLKKDDMFAFCKTSVLKDLNEKQIILRNAWISYSMYKANKIESKEFNLNALKNRISEIRKMTLEDINDFLPKLKQFLSDAGVKFVYLPYLKGSNISGVTKWLPKEKAVMIAVNDCGKDAGKLWFSIFHELGHAIKNHKRHLTLSKEKDNIIDSDEIEANEFANNNLIDKNKYKEFIDKGDFSITSIKRFAKEQGIGDFIVIGRLQKDQIIECDKYQQYKKRYEYNNCN